MTKTESVVIKLMLVDDHPIVREGIRSRLSNQPNMKIVAEAENGKEAIRRLQEFSPHVVLMDINMPEMNGLEATKVICKIAPKTKVLVLSMHQDKEYVVEIMRSGARGYVLKNSPPSELIRAIELVHAGQAFFSPDISSVLLDELARGPEKSAAGGLSQREREVLSLIAAEFSNKEIADKLGVSVRTIETHRERLMRKLDIHNVAGLTKFAIANGILKLE
jgi:two-component system nitrate/nitrite response regulator NarL